MRTGQCDATATTTILKYALHLCVCVFYLSDSGWQVVIAEHSNDQPNVTVAGARPMHPARAEHETPCMVAVVARP